MFNEVREKWFTRMARHAPCCLCFATLPRLEFHSRVILLSLSSNTGSSFALVPSQGDLRHFCRLTICTRRSTPAYSPLTPLTLPNSDAQPCQDGGGRGRGREEEEGEDETQREERRTRGGRRREDREGGVEDACLMRNPEEGCRNMSVSSHLDVAVFQKKK